MAERSSRSRNVSFLKEQEQLRLAKPSSLAIDLRNKVNGECQAYRFGGVTHYLDDRGYLLAKRLMERYNGRYTIGVYELLHKAIKTLIENEANDNVPSPVKPAPLFRDAQRVQMLAIDTIFERSELRIVYATDVTLEAGELRYHGSTLDLSSSALRVSIKRAYTLSQDQVIKLSFPDFLQENGEPFHDIAYCIQHISHTATRTQLVLTRQTPHAEFERWFHSWAQQYKSLAKIDVGHQLSNIAHRFYLRLYLQSMHKPVLWFGALHFPDPIKAIHLNAHTSRVMAHIQNKDGKLNLALLPLQQVIQSTHTAYLVFITITHGVVNSVILPYPSPLLKHALSHEVDQVLLMQHQPVSFQHYDIEQQCADLMDIDAAQAHDLASRLTTIQDAVMVTDITASCQWLPQQHHDRTLVSTLTNQQILSAPQPVPQSLHHYIHRQHQRYLIHTDISLYLRNEHLTVTTLDVSEQGLSLSLTGHFPVAEGTRVRVNFIRWQNQTKQIKLTDIPYIVRRMQYWEGVTTLGLERNTLACGEKINQFFAETIAANRTELALDTQDKLTIHESALFGEQIAQHMSNKPFYIGLDQEGNRIIQAVANTSHNQADDLADFWIAFSHYAHHFSDWIRRSRQQREVIPDFGVYCYLDKQQQWQIQTDLQFTHAEQKAVFIHRALLAKRYYFFHCTLTAIKSASIEQEADLEQQLSSIRRHSPHHIRTLRDVIRHLCAVGDLTDITPLIETAYRH